MRRARTTGRKLFVGAHEMKTPEYSINDLLGLHEKSCGDRVTCPGVRIMRSESPVDWREEINTHADTKRQPGRRAGA